MTIINQIYIMVIDLANKLIGHEYTVLARRYTVPPNKLPVFQEFTVKAVNRYQACRVFDQELTAWTRLDVTLKR